MILILILPNDGNRKRSPSDFPEVSVVRGSFEFDWLNEGWFSFSEKEAESCAE